MTADRVPVDDFDALRSILANTKALLLDFDGPVCSVFAGFPAPVVADQLRDVLAHGGHRDLPAIVEKTGDPFDVFKFAYSLGKDEARYVEAALSAHEVEAIATAEPTVGAHELIRLWASRGKRLAIVSNNGVAAVTAYLAKYELGGYIDVVAARSNACADLLKPNPHLVLSAQANLNVPPNQCVLIGDSVSDIQAAGECLVDSIGFANRDEKVMALTDAGALAIARSMNLLLEGAS